MYVQDVVPDLFHMEFHHMMYIIVVIAGCGVMKTKQELVSIIIPTVPKRGNELKKTLKTIKSQTYKNIETVVVNDASISATEARNVGIQKAKGKFITTSDDDDNLLPTKIEEQVKAFENEDDVVLVICWIDDKRFGESYIVKYNEYIELKDVLKMFNLAASSAYMFRADFLKQQLFDTSFPSAQDYDLAIRAATVSKIKCVQKVLVEQRSSKNQISKDWKRKKKGLRLLLKKHKTLYMEYGLTTYINFRIKFFGLQCLYTLAYIFGERIYKIIIPLKKRM